MLKRKGKCAAEKTFTSEHEGTTMGLKSCLAGQGTMQRQSKSFRQPFMGESSKALLLKELLLHSGAHKRGG
jgi:hypothetical protein